jgi:23S rRNA (pseudouridine1915-N3)-methyltransferase
LKHYLTRFYQALIVIRAAHAARIVLYRQFILRNILQKTRHKRASMKIRLLTIGQKMPDWVQTGFDDYFKRVQPLITVQLVELPMAKRGKSDSAADIHKYCQIEGQSILNSLQPRERLIALEVGGRNLTTEKLATTMQNWMLDGLDIALAVGGPDGLSDEVRQKAEWHWSLSPLTLPHPLVRVIMIEQLYRAMSINHGHPYHRA